MALVLPCTYPVRPSAWTRLRRWVRRQLGRQAPQDVLPDVCGVSTPHNASCGVCGCVMAACDRHGGMLGMFAMMRLHLDAHDADDKGTQSA